MLSKLVALQFELNRMLTIDTSRRWLGCLSVIVDTALELGVDVEKLVLCNFAESDRMDLRVTSRYQRNYFHEVDPQFYEEASALVNIPAFHGFFIDAANGDTEVRVVDAISWWERKLKRF